MSLEAMQVIVAAEENARQQKASSAAAAKKRIADARIAGEAMVAEAEKRAQHEIEELFADVNSRSTALARELADKNEAGKAALRAAAESKMPEAVSFIVERIVKSR